MGLPLKEITEFLRSFAPLELAESWDNVGLLLGDEHGHIQSAMTCLTLTDPVAEEAVRRKADLIISHHPILFRPVQKITSVNTEGRLLLKLLTNGIAVYSPHTAFDSARMGINQQLAEMLGLRQIEVLRPSAMTSNEKVVDLGAGRIGQLPDPISLRDFLELVRARLLSKGKPRPVPPLAFSGDPRRRVTRIAIGCGSAGEFLKDAVRTGCDVFLTGEARFHTSLEAIDNNIALVLAGHYQTERPAVESLAELLQTNFPQLSIWASEEEYDPIQWSDVQ